MTLTNMLDDLEAKAKAASPGPYHIGHLNEWDNDRMDIVGPDGVEIADEVRQRDVDYWFAANPATILRMIAAIRTMKQDLERLFSISQTAPRAALYAVVKAAIANVSEL